MQTYTEVIDYLYAQLPMFTRDGATAINKGLERTEALCEALGNPQRKLKMIHVAGTNGKGSTSHMLASVLSHAGYKTGLYTSPHLLDFRERIRIDGEMIPQEYVIDFVQRNRALIEKIKPSFFEVTLALCFGYFALQEIDYAVIEVGLGGRLDSTNIITPLLSVITNIGLDHVDILGDTLPLIASEKAGIIKHNIPVVISEFQEEIAPVFLQIAQDLGSTILFAPDDREVVSCRQTDNHLEVAVKRASMADIHTFQLDLKGTYQQKNLLGVLSAVDVLRQLGLDISDQQVAEGLRNTQQQTSLMGRWQTISTNPKIICDTGHNEAGIREVMYNLYQENYSQLHIVLGVMRDKDLNQVLPLLPKEAIYYFCAPEMPRAMDALVLQGKATPFGLLGNAYSSVEEAVSNASTAATADDLIFVGGSTFVVAEALKGLSK